MSETSRPGNCLTGIRVLVSGSLPPPIGGVSEYLRTLLASSLRDRVELSFVSTSASTRDYDSGGRMSASNVRLAFADVVRFRRALRAKRPQVAHVTTAGGLSFVKHSFCIMLARASGSRVLLHPHCSVRVLYTDRPGWWKRYFRFVVGRCAGVIALSQEWTALRDEIPGCVVHHVPNAVDVKQYGGIAADRRARSQLRSPLTVLYLGHLGSAKGSFDLLEAARLAKAGGESWQFELIGDEISAGDRDRLRAEVSSLGVGDTVRIGDSVTGDAKLQAFARADVFVYPSYHEGMPMAIIEAMACALPVVASRVGGIPDLVDDGVSGILIEPACPGELVRAIRSVVDDGSKHVGMGENALRRADGGFSFEQRVDDLVAIYEEAVS
jgi:glycosyltransferase involved in cell wall biosynthesis